MSFRNLYLTGALLCTALPVTAFPALPRVESRTYGVKDWRLTIETMRFTGEVTCRLYAKDYRIVYIANALGLYAGRGYDIISSWFRLDNRQALRWREQLPELARLRVAIDARDMERPTGGMVWLPLTLIKDTQRVDVATNSGAKLRSFDLRGFAELHAAALYLGCTPEGRFVQ